MNHDTFYKKKASMMRKREREREEPPKIAAAPTNAVSKWSGNVARDEMSKRGGTIRPVCDDCKLKSARIALLGMQETIVKTDCGSFAVSQ
jgi:hypothetical protein